MLVKTFLNVSARHFTHLPFCFGFYKRFLDYYSYLLMTSSRYTKISLRKKSYFI